MSRFEIYRENGKLQVYAMTADGAKREPVGPAHDTRESALAFRREMLAGVNAANLLTGAISFEADEMNPRILRFKNVVLARPEINKNRDAVTEEGIRELADTIAGMPLDVDHDSTKNIGAFTAGRVGDQGELRVDGFVWLDRCEAMGVSPSDVLAGQYGLSIEADAATAECSKCHRVHSSAGEYCSHIANLRARLSHGAARVLRGLRAIGGALTRRPAGSATGWDAASNIVFVASHQEVDMAEIERREDVSDADIERAKKEYGDVEYADEKNKKYPLDEEHIRAAISYFSMPKNRAKYSPEEQALIWSRIKRAAEKFGIEVSDDNKEEASMDEEQVMEPVPEKAAEEYEALKRELAEVTAKFEAAVARESALTTELMEAKNRLAEAESQLKANRVEKLRARFAGSMDSDVFERNLDWLLTLDEDRLALVAAANKTPEPSRLKVAASEQPPVSNKWTLF